MCSLKVRFGQLFRLLWSFGQLALDFALDLCLSAQWV